METILLFMFIIHLNSTTNTIKVDTPKAPIKRISVSRKKKNFYTLFVPAIQNVHEELIYKYNRISKDINNTETLPEIELLKKKYKVTTDKELLMALKPHPQSIVLAQAAMESAWGTSRFFVEANNVFGMWSVDVNEPRIAAGVKRAGRKTIWLKKFTTIEDSIRAYYKLLATADAYTEFRELRLVSDDPHLLVKKLHKYSEIGERYGEELTKVIKYNNLTKYDK